jgi:hypothetical protein
MRYYAFEYTDGLHTTTGDPHPKTGRYNIAGEIHLFFSSHSRAQFILEATSQKKILPITLKELRQHRQGQTVQEFKDDLDFLSYSIMQRE